jgi:ribosomal protein S18 acetylase RimI-like enzyme
MVAVTVRQAKPAELALVMEILDEAARWLLARGIRQWESPPPAECWMDFREEIARERVYLIILGASEEVVGTFRVASSGTPLWKDDANAGYLYSLAVRPRLIGRGIGAAVIERMAEHFTVFGKQKFRLDCIAANTELRKWYEGLGFRYRGVATDGPYVLALYERDLPDLEIAD